MKYYRTHILVCVDPECLGKGAHDIEDALQDELVAQGLMDEVQVLETPRIGGCSHGPEIMVYPDGVHYVGLSADDIPFLVEEHFLKGRVAKKFLLPQWFQIAIRCGRIASWSAVARQKPSRSDAVTSQLAPASCCISG